MDNWTKDQLKIYKPKYTALIDNFYKQYPIRLKGMLELTDPHNTNIKATVTQRIFASLSGILPQNLNKLLRGRDKGGANISIEQAIRISTVLGCSLDYLVTGKEVLGTDSSLRENLETERRLRKMVEEENERLKDEIEKLKARKKKK